ncbi:MAG: T9SS type A sorting domain-containing protein [Candidatus Electryoneaceae bacterium]|nr:T9SS type A sorting domain-containing protein [Candidatus Electryoneaceae bacterium]
MFIASEGSHIYEIALDGENIEIVDAYRVRLPGEDISIYGMAWNEMDHETPLYIMDRTPTDDSGEMRLIKYNPETRRTRIVKQLAQYDTETGTGLSFSPLWEPGIYSLATVAGSRGGDFAPDTVRIYNAGPDCRFISYDLGPHLIDANENFGLELQFDASGIRSGDYQIGLFIEHNAASDPIVIPVTLRVNPAWVTDGNITPPLEFDLSEAFPNPFNGITRIDFMLKHSGTTRLVVYDLTGREVAVLADGEFNAGSHSVVFEADRMASGLYFYRLESQGQSIVKRMVLLR